MDVFRDLPRFLVEAKRRTYAGLDDDATIAAPALSGSKQLEFVDGDFHYRDVYFGMAFFVGLETVSRNSQPIWSMSYSGGTLPNIQGREVMLSVYAFLRQALLRISESAPYRGPSSFEDGAFRYENTVTGDFIRFYGRECIYHARELAFELHYCGGALK